jgi:GAF domain-containing protein
MTQPPSDEARRAAVDALVAVARRLDAVIRSSPAADDTLLGAVVRTAASVLDAQAASIALYDPDRDQLVFMAAAGPASGEVVGMRIDAATGIAGYAFSTSQPLAIADVGADPRFDRTVAEATGYVPQTILATPLADDEGTVGVLEVLDRRGGSFSLRDLEVAAALASEATIVVRSDRIRQETSALLRSVLAAVASAEDQAVTLDEAAIDALVSETVSRLAVDPDDPTWLLADRLARLREVDPDSVALAVEWLDALLRRRGRRSRGSGPSPSR